MDIAKIIKKLEEVLDLLKNENNNDANANVVETRNEPAPDSATVFEELKNLLNSEEWPQAAPDFLICDESEKDKLERADGILSYLGMDLKDKKFLDFGCGEGHVAKKASSSGAIESVGYDLKSSGPYTWETPDNNFILTTNFERLKSKAPYDYVLLYDVLDHCDDPLSVLNSIHQITDQSSKIFVRCHPISSRHATHQYRKLNKAFIQLVFTDDEIKSLGLENDIKQKTFYPVADNTRWFQKAKFKIVSHDSVKSQVEEFFRNNKTVASRIMRPPYHKGFPDHQMQQVFNDYTLIKIV